MYSIGGSMTFTDQEKEGCRRILKKLDNKELNRLAKTVTGQKRMRRTTEGLIEAILKHSKHAKDLLQRRKVTCNSIYKYLEENHALPQGRTKPALVDKAIAYWKDTGNNAPRAPAQCTEQVRGGSMGIRSQGPGNIQQNLLTSPTHMFIGIGNLVAISESEQQIQANVRIPGIQQHPPARN